MRLSEFCSSRWSRPWPRCPRAPRTIRSWAPGTSPAMRPTRPRLLARGERRRRHAVGAVPQPRRQPGAGEGRQDRQRRADLHHRRHRSHKTVVSLNAAGGKLTGTVGAQAVKVTGVRPPTWGACDANAAHTFGTPVALFDGKSVDAWDPQNKAKPLGWSDRGRRDDQQPPREQPRLEGDSSRTSGSRRNTSCRRRATAASTCAAATRCRCWTTPGRRRETCTGTWRSTRARRRTRT